VRRVATAASVASAIAAVLAALTVGGRIASDREATRARYRDAIDAQRVGASRGVVPRPPAPEQSTICVRGVDTPVAALSNVRPKATLELLSALAVSAYRSLERASGEPAIPQRMGRRATADAGGTLHWSAIDAPALTCGGRPATARLHVALPR